MKIRLHPYQPAWKEAFEEHRARIAAALSPLQPSIDHIGSTALGDIAAKPIIDMLVGLPRDEQLEEAIAPMVAAGYTYVEAFTSATPNRRFFVKLKALTARPLAPILRPTDPLRFGRGYDTVANIHVMMRDTHHWIRHLAFRDYLLAHPQVRRAYEALKREIAAIDLEDPLDYNSYKESFIAEHQAKALAWFRRRSAPEGQSL